MSTLNKIITPWTQFHNVHKPNSFKCVYLMGTQNSGKSTLCQLFNSFIANKKHEKLVYEDGKLKQYVLPNIISSNSLKIQTMEPVVYQIQSKIADMTNLTVVDVPTYAFSPFNQANKKLWSAIDSKVTFNYMINTAQKCSFALVIDQKFTRAPMDGTKSILINFIDSFLQFPPQLFNSTAIIVTKCPAGFKLDTCITRIEGCIKKIDDPNVKHIEQWFKNVKDRNAILVFNKFTTQQTTKQQVKTIYKFLTNLIPYHVDLNQVKSFEHLSQDLKEQIKKFIGILPQGFRGLINLMLEVADQMIKDEAQYQSHKNQLIQKLFGTNVNANSSTNNGAQKTTKIQQLKIPTLFNVLSVCNAIYNLSKSDQEDNLLENLLDKFVEFDIISKEEQIYIGLKQKIDFYSSIKNKFQIFPQSQKQLIKQFDKKCQSIKSFKKVTKSIKDSYSEGKPLTFYQNLISLIQFIVPQNIQSHELLQIWIKSSLEIAGNLPKAKSLLRFLQIQSKLSAWKRFDLVSNLLAKIGQVLMSVNQVGFAVGFYSKCGNPYRGIQQMQKVLNDKDIRTKSTLKQLLPYLELLQDLGLYEKSYQKCYQLGNIYDSNQQRKQLQSFLKKSPSLPKDHVIESFINRKVKGLEQKQVFRLKQLAENLSKQM